MSEDGIRNQYHELDEDLRPHWEQLVRAAHAKGLLVSGFIWGDPVPEANTDGDNPYLVRFGNLSVEDPQTMFSIHYQLAVMAVKLELAGKSEYCLTPADASAASPSPKVASPLDIADKLAVMLIATPFGDLPREVLDLLDQYLQVRRPTLPESGK
jgi:hypothetical protein